MQPRNKKLIRKNINWNKISSCMKNRLRPICSFIDWIKSFTWNSPKLTKYNRHRESAGRYSSQNVMTITTKMMILVKVNIFFYWHVTSQHRGWWLSTDFIFLLTVNYHDFLTKIMDWFFITFSMVWKIRIVHVLDLYAPKPTISFILKKGGSRMDSCHFQLHLCENECN